MQSESNLLDLFLGPSMYDNQEFEIGGKKFTITDISLNFRRAQLLYMKRTQEGEKEFKEWMLTKNPYLGNRSPLQVILSDKVLDVFKLISGKSSD